MQLPPPQHWWNEYKHPTIACEPFAFPAEILPYTIAVAFIFWKTYPGARRPRMPAEAHQQVPAAIPQEDAAQPPAAVAPNLDFRAAQALAFFHNTLTVRALWTTEVHNPGRKDVIVPDIDILCLAQAAALLLGGLEFGETGSGLPCTLTSLGWIVFKYSDYGSRLDLALVVALAVPCVWKFTGPVGFGGQASGLLLLLLVIDAALPEKAALREWNLLWSIELWRIGVIFGAQAIEYMVHVVRSTPQLRRQSWYSYQEYLTEAIASGLEAFGDEMARTLVSFAMLASSVICTGFLNACLAWKYLILGLPSESPFVVGLATLVGSLSYVVPWVLVLHFRRGRRQPLVQVPIAEILRTESAFFGEAIGWSVTILTALHFVLSRVYGGK